jgi:hypothetical protein
MSCPRRNRSWEMESSRCFQHIPCILHTFREILKKAKRKALRNPWWFECTTLALDYCPSFRKLDFLGRE